MDKTKFFIKLVCRFCGKMKIARPLLWKDNRLGKSYVASVLEGINLDTNKRRQVMRYNERLISKMPILDIIHTVFHELGHIKTKGKTRIEKEYKAEKFALKAMKKYYPKYYKTALNYLKKACNFCDRIYATAFKKLLKEVK